mgnify:CR=1 FL=1
MEGEVVDALPLVVLGALFFPDEDLAVEAGGGEDVTVLGMRPGDAPYSTFVAVAFVSCYLSAYESPAGLPLECLYQTL